MAERKTTTNKNIIIKDNINTTKNRINEIWINTNTRKMKTIYKIDNIFVQLMMIRKEE